MPLTAADIAKHLDGVVIGDATVEITGFAPADRARPGDLTFAENESYFVRAANSAAAAVLVEEAFAPSRKTLIRVASARLACAKVLPLFFPEPTAAPGLHPSAVVHGTATIDPTASVGPHCVIAEGVRIGPRSVLDAAVVVGAGCRIGAEVRIFPNVTLYPRTEVGDRVRIHAGCVLGADGFGYVQEGGVHVKVPQIGNVIIRDDVELGACVTIDRGALGPTIIGAGTKIDNLVQVAHNVTVGENCLIVAQAGIAGSTKLGNSVILGGQAGLAGHLRIGNRVAVAAKAGVMHNLKDGEKVLGTPAIPDRQAKRQIIALQHLPELRRRVQEIERHLGLHPEGSADAGARPSPSRAEPDGQDATQ